MKINVKYFLGRDFRKNVSFMFVVYWAVMVAWQNISRAQPRSSVDMMIKIGVLAYFVCFFLRHSRKVSRKILWVLLLTLCLLMTAFVEAQFTLGTLISYFYPIIFLAMAYGLGDRFEINREQLISFCNCVIAITLYAAIYALIFCGDQFANLSSLRSAYGNELKSFFLSSHEYALYLAAAIISCVLCMRLNPDVTRKQKAYYLTAMAIMIPNFILTYSRTALAGLVLFLLTFVFLGNGKIRRIIITAIILFLLACVFIPQMTDFIYRIVLKENRVSGRDILAAGAVDYFWESTFFCQIFGSGFYATRTFFEMQYSHGSVHNAYLQVLLYYGIAGLLFLIVFLVTQLYTCWKFMKKERFLGAVYLGFVIMSAMMMITNTQIIFTSQMDSYFMTIFMFVVPKYVRNAINNNRF